MPRNRGRRAELESSDDTQPSVRPACRTNDEWMARAIKAVLQEALEQPPPASSSGAKGSLPRRGPALASNGHQSGAFVTPSRLPRPSPPSTSDSARRIGPRAARNVPGSGGEGTGKLTPLRVPPSVMTPEDAHAADALTALSQRAGEWVDGVRHLYAGAVALLQADDESAASPQHRPAVMASAPSASAPSASTSHADERTTTTFIPLPPSPASPYLDVEVASITAAVEAVNKKTPWVHPSATAPATAPAVAAPAVAAPAPAVLSPNTSKRRISFKSFGFPTAGAPSASRVPTSTLEVERASGAAAMALLSNFAAIEPRLVGSAASRLATLLAPRRARGTSSREEQLEYVRQIHAGAPALLADVVHAMDTYAEAADVQESACCLVVRLCDSDARRQAAVSAGMMRAIAAALHAHPKSAALLQWAPVAVLLLTQDSVSRAYAAISAGVREGLRTAADAASDKPLKTRAAHLARRWLDYNAHILGGHAGSGYSAGLTPGDADATRRLEEMFGETGSFLTPAAAAPTSSMPLSFGWFGAWIGEAWDSMLPRSAPGTPRTLARSGSLWSRTKRRLSGDKGRDARSIAVRL